MSVKQELDKGSFYRGIGYSISYFSGGKWLWKLHLKLKHGVSSPMISGEVADSHEAAVAAAQRAIDEHLSD